jgi:crossover junction endodeoxyribonuclease RuvC
MSLLAVDLGTKTGWAARLPDGTVLSGTMNFVNDRFSGGGMRFLRFRRWLDEIHKTLALEEVAFEEVRRHRGTDAAHVYGGLLATLTSWCEEKQIPYLGYSVGAIKKSICGKGNADKVAVIEAIEAKGFKPKDDNEADALALLLLASPPPPS